MWIPRLTYDLPACIPARSNKKKEKFQRLMGIKGEVAAAIGPALPPPGGHSDGHTAMRLEEQEKVLKDVEGAFVAGVSRRADGRTVGLGAER